MGPSYLAPSVLLRTIEGQDVGLKLGRQWIHRLLILPNPFPLCVGASAPNPIHHTHPQADLTLPLALAIAKEVQEYYQE